MAEVTAVEASLTVVLDMVHPPWDLEERRGEAQRAGGRVQAPPAAMLGTEAERWRNGTFLPRVLTPAERKNRPRSHTQPRRTRQRRGAWAASNAR